MPGFIVFGLPNLPISLKLVLLTQEKNSMKSPPVVSQLRLLKLLAAGCAYTLVWLNVLKASKEKQSWTPGANINYVWFQSR